MLVLFVHWKRFSFVFVFLLFFLCFLCFALCLFCYFAWKMAEYKEGRVHAGIDAWWQCTFHWQFILQCYSHSLRGEKYIKRKIAIDIKIDAFSRSPFCSPCVIIVMVTGNIFRIDQVCARVFFYFFSFFVAFFGLSFSPLWAHLCTNAINQSVYVWTAISCVLFSRRRFFLLLLVFKKQEKKKPITRSSWKFFFKVWNWNSLAYIFIYVEIKSSRTSDGLSWRARKPIWNNLWIIKFIVAKVKIFIQFNFYANAYFIVCICIRKRCSIFALEIKSIINKFNYPSGNKSGTAAAVVASFERFALKWIEYATRAHLSFAISVISLSLPLRHAYCQCFDVF